MEQSALLLSHESNASMNTKLCACLDTWGTSEIEHVHEVKDSVLTDMSMESLLNDRIPRIGLRTNRLADG